LILFNIFIFVFLACELLKLQPNLYLHFEGDRIPKVKSIRADALF
jgi:hypothetical protein